MKTETFFFDGSDKAKIFSYKWSPDDGIKIAGAVQIAHGMAEHAARYERFAAFLTSNGFVVYANDHRGHNKTAGSLENTGFFADKNGWALVVEDMHILTGKIKEQNPGLPIFLFGHSMGSFLSRNYIYTYPDEFTGVILSGTGGNPGLLGKVGKMIAGIEKSIKGPRHRSTLLNGLSFGSFNKPFKPNRTDFDWLSRDDDEIAGLRISDLTTDCTTTHWGDPFVHYSVKASYHFGPFSYSMGVRGGMILVRENGTWKVRANQMMMAF